VDSTVATHACRPSTRRSALVQAVFIRPSCMYAFLNGVANHILHLIDESHPLAQNYILHMHDVPAGPSPH
jgi:hypothetical protein